MPINVLRGDAVPVAQVWKAIPATVEIGDVFRLAINGKLGVTYTALAASVADVTAGLTKVWNASVIAEFTEIIAADVETHITLTAATAGTPFFVIASTSNTGSGNVNIVETTKGVEAGNEVQKLELNGTYTGGTFTLTFDGQITGNIPYDATAATVQTALEALSNIAVGDIVVTGGPGPSTPWFITWQGVYAAIEVNEMTVGGANLVGNGDVEIETTTQGGGKSNELKGFRITATGGTYTLTLPHPGGETTAPIAHDATAATIKSALEAIGTIGTGNVEVYGGKDEASPNTWYFYVMFKGDLAEVNVGRLNPDESLLTGSVNIRDITTGGEVSKDEFQFVSVGQATAGTYTLTRGGQTTEPIDFGEHPRAIADALEALPNVAVGDVGVFLGHLTENFDGSLAVVIGGHYLVRFKGTLSDTNVALMTMATGNLTGATSPGVSSVQEGGGQVDEIQTVIIHGTGGTFTLTFNGQTTIATAWNATAATVDANLTALSTITSVTVTGTGTPADPYDVTFTDPGDEDVAEMTADASLLSGGGGKATEVTSHIVAVDEVQTVTIGAGVTGGAFPLTFGGVPTSGIAYNAAAATLETELEAISTIDGVTVAGSAGGPWTVTFDSATLGGMDVPLLGGDGSSLVGGSGTETLTLTETTRSAGPNHWDDPSNWTLGRVPHSLDNVIVAGGRQAMLYGLTQRLTFAADAGTDTLTLTAAADFVVDQAVRVKSDDTLPAGLVADTDYYVLNIDRDAFTLQLAATPGGAAIDITDAGTGTHTVAVELNALDVQQTYRPEMGLPLRTTSGYYEYRPQYLKIGMAPGGEKKITIGEGDGSGSGRIKIDTGDYATELEVIDTGGSREPGIEPLLFLNSNAATNINILEGELGVAVLPAESATINKLTQRAGTVTLGSVTLNEIDRTGGELTGREVSLNGALRMVG